MLRIFYRALVFWDYTAIFSVAGGARKETSSTSSNHPSDRGVFSDLGPIYPDTGAYSCQTPTVCIFELLLEKCIQVLYLLPIFSPSSSSLSWLQTKMQALFSIVGCTSWYTGHFYIQHGTTIYGWAKKWPTRWIECLEKIPTPGKITKRRIVTKPHILVGAATIKVICYFFAHPIYFLYIKYTFAWGKNIWEKMTPSSKTQKNPPFLQNTLSVTVVLSPARNQISSMCLMWDF